MSREVDQGTEHARNGSNVHVGNGLALNEDEEPFTLPGDGVGGTGYRAAARLDEQVDQLEVRYFERGEG